MGNILLYETEELAALRLVTTCKPIDNTPVKYWFTDREPK
jgi:hypothetical protein